MLQTFNWTSACINHFIKWNTREVLVYFIYEGLNSKVCLVTVFPSVVSSTGSIIHLKKHNLHLWGKLDKLIGNCQLETDKIVPEAHPSAT